MWLLVGVSVVGVFTVGVSVVGVFTGRSVSGGCGPW